MDRGLMFAFVGAHLGRQFEFVQSEWMNDSAFFGGSPGRDPVSGAADGSRHIRYSQAAASSAIAGSASIRGHAGRRILLHAGAAGAGVARELDDLVRYERRQG